MRSRGAFPFYALLRGLAYPAARSACPKPARRGERRANAFRARADDIDDLVFDFLRDVFLSSFDYSFSLLPGGRLFLGKISEILNV